MPKIIIVVTVLLAVIALVACGPRPDANTALVVAEHRAAAVPDAVDHDARLADALTLDREDRLARREWVAEEEARWKEFAGMVDARRQRIERPFLYDGQPADRRRMLVGVADALAALEDCVGADTAWIEAWSEMGHLRLAVGDRAEAKACLERALTAAAEIGPAAAEIMLRTHRDLAWALRELALHDEGLAAISAGLEEFPGDEDLLLVKGLILGDAGRFDEAVQLARRLPKRRLRYEDPRNKSFYDGETNWPKRWIRSRAWLGRGDPVRAYRELDEEPDGERTDIYDLRGQGWKLGFGAVFDHQRRFWNDVGFVAELLGDPSSVDFYVASFHDRVMSVYFPSQPDVRSPLVMGVPDGVSPSITSFAHGHYVSGSPWGYVALQMDLMSLALFPGQRDRAADEALAMLDVLDRQGLRPAENAALRGRILYRQEKYPEARPHLTAARDSFAARGETDARTCLLLGLMDLAREDFSSAVRLLEDAARADERSPVTWRMLGVAYANLDRTDDALAVMDKAVRMEPRSLAGHYNRGLLKLQMRHCSDAAIDLQRARTLAPENAEVQRLLQVATTCVQALESGAEEAVPQVRPGGAEAVLATPTTDMLMEHLIADLDDLFTPPAPAALDSLPELADRTTRALRCVDTGDHAGARELLAARWGEDLTPLEEVVLLHAERRLGEDERLIELVKDALTGEVKSSNPYVWTLMVLEVRRDPGQYGAVAEERLMARLLDHAAEFSGRTVREWAVALRRELEEARES